MQRGDLPSPDELGDELAHALVAPDEGRGVVVIPDPLVLHHVLEVADDGGGVQVAAAGRDQRLVLVQGDGAGGTDAAEVDPAAVGEQGPCRGRRRRPLDLGLVTADVGQLVHVFG